MTREKLEMSAPCILEKDSFQILIIIVQYKDETQGQSGLIGALIKSFLAQRHIVLLTEYCMRSVVQNREETQTFP